MSLKSKTKFYFLFLLSQEFVGGVIICVMFGKQPPYPVNTYGLHYKRI